MATAMPNPSKWDDPLLSSTREHYLRDVLDIHPSPSHQKGVFSWDFVRDVLAKEKEHVVPSTSRRYLFVLAEIVRMEGKLDVAKEYVDTYWLACHKYNMTGVNVMDLPLLLFVLDRWDEGRNVLEKILRGLFKTEGDYPRDRPPKFYDVPQLIQIISQISEHVYTYWKPRTQTFFLMMCYGAGELARARAALEATKDCLKGEALKEKQEELNKIWKFTKLFADFMHDTSNGLLLPGISDPSTLDFNEPRYLPSINTLVMEHPRDVDRKEIAKEVISVAMPLVKLAGFEDAVKEVAAEIGSRPPAV